MQMYQALKPFFNNLLKPKSNNKDDARREFILSVLLLGLIVLVAITFFITLINPYFDESYSGSSPIESGSIFIILLVLFSISKSQKSKLAAYLFIISLSIVAIYMLSIWGADLPILLLFFALLIVMSGILINSQFAFAVAAVGSASVIIFTQLELMGFISPNALWKIKPIAMVDSVANAVILGIIAIVSWLFNREMERALRRARRSEATVKRQRDNLEILVERRTRELRFAQAEKYAQLYRFAELGKMATGIFHDLATPLGLVSLNLDQLREQHKKGKKLSFDDSQLHMQRALDGTRRLEEFLSIARKQVQNEEVKEWFSINKEIERSILILEYKARKTGVVVEKGVYNKANLYGSSTKFSQAITNLIANAIDSYQLNAVGKKVEVSVLRGKDKVHISVRDWGKGIDKKNMKKIFEPLFTTKSRKKGMGMGLSICRNVVEKEMKGKITVESEKKKGTTFTISLPIKQRRANN